MTTATITPSGWYTDPTGRHEYRYWDGANWTAMVSDGGITATDSPELQPPTPPTGSPAVGSPAAPAMAPAVAEAPTVGYRAATAARWRIAAVWVALVGVLLAFLFEAVASVLLRSQIVQSSFGVPSQSTFEWWAWLYHYAPVAVAYGYPPLGLWLALFLAAVLLSSLLLPPIQALKKAGCRAPFRWSAPTERARLSLSLRELGCSKTLLRGRGRRGLVITSELAALAATGISAYALIAKQGMGFESGTFTGESVGGLSVGLGPKVCLVAGLVAVIGGLVAWPWGRERHVMVLPDGSIRTDLVSASGAAMQEPPVTTVPLAALAQPTEPSATPAVAAAGGPPELGPAQGRRRRWAVPLIALIGVLGLILGLLIWAPWGDKGPTIASPVGLVAGTSTTSSVAFHWSRPTTAPTPDSYVILRNGAVLRSVPGTVTTYQDTGLAPATTYQYTVAAVSGGKRSAPSTALVVKTLAPAISAARLQGTWDVNTKVTKSPGGTFTVGETATETWDFTPKCATGPCAVVVSGVLWSHPFTATLTPSGGVYTGSTRAHITHCGPIGSEVDTQNTVALRITVKTAGVDAQQWTARSWVGSLVLSAPYTSAGMYYCPAQSVTASLAASQ
jgi:hypothetical protein